MTYFANNRKAVRRAFNGRERFHEMVQDYVMHRARIDPDWKRADSFEASTDTIAFDPDGDVEIEWEERGRCGDQEYYRRTFPAEHLWDPEAMVKVEAEVLARHAQEKAKREAQYEAQRKTKEEQDRKLLAALQEQYGGQAVSCDQG